MTGQYTTNLGEKNRIAVPKKIRNELGTKMIIARWYEKCLVLVSIASWQELLNKLTANIQTITLPVRDTERFILGSAFDIETDSQGRFVIPTYLKEYADIKDEVVFLGLGNRVEIWSKQLWLKREEYISAHAAELLEELAKGTNNA